MDLPENEDWVNFQTAAEIAGVSRQLIWDSLQQFPTKTRIGTQGVIWKQDVVKWAEARQARFAAAAAAKAAERRAG